jgi:hypothetical protein
LWIVPFLSSRIANRVGRQPKEDLIKKQRTLPVLLAAMVSIVCVGAAGATDATPKHAKAKEGTTTVHRERGADGLVDSTITGPKGGVTTVDRSRGADGVVDKTVTGPRAGHSKDRM